MKTKKETANPKYSLSRVLNRMLKSAWHKNKRIFAGSFFHMVVAGLAPFFPVLLPKLIIGVLERSGGLGGSGMEDGAQAALGWLTAWDTSFSPAVQIVLIGAAYFTVAGLFGFLQTFLSDHFYNPVGRLRLECLSDTCRKLLTIDYRYWEDAGFLDRYEKALESTNSNDNGVEGIYHKLFAMPAQVLTIAILAVLVSLASPLILVGILLNILVGFWVQNKANHFQYSMREVEGKAVRRRNYYNATTYDFNYGKDIRLFGFGKRVIDNYNREIDRYLDVIRLVRAKEFRLGFLALSASLLSDILTYGCLIYSVLNGMAISDFSMYLSAVLTLTTQLAAFSGDVAFLYQEGLYVEEYFRFYDDELGSEGGSRTALADTLEIEFRKVSFRYPGTEKDVFKNLDFTIHKGEKLAIVGINGAGKSTLVKLMTGLFEPTEGEIFINGIPQKEFRKAEYFKMFSVVFQEINPLAYTLGENVACAADDVNKERVWDCLDRVGLGGKVKEFDKGLDQMLLKIIDEDGTQFSGGENQKLMIARALYKDANMVILDEPTAALDALAEAEIYQDFDGLVAGKTAVYISHRLSSTKFCDKIALFDGGGLAEYGNHEELMEKRGAYYNMFSIQGKYYRGEESA